LELVISTDESGSFIQIFEFERELNLSKAFVKDSECFLVSWFKLLTPGSTNDSKLLWWLKLNFDFEEKSVGVGSTKRELWELFSSLMEPWEEEKDKDNSEDANDEDKLSPRP